VVSSPRKLGLTVGPESRGPLKFVISSGRAVGKKALSPWQWLALGSFLTVALGPSIDPFIPTDL